MRRSVTLAIAVWITSIFTQHAKSDDGPTFKRVMPTDSVQFAKIFSTDLRVGSLIFDNFITATEIGRGALPSVETKSFTYVLQIDGDKESTVTQSIRGFVSTEGTGSAAVLIHSGGKTIAVDLEKAIDAAKKGTIPRDPELQKQVEAATKEKAGVRASNTNDDFYVAIQSTVPQGQPLQTTIILLVHRLPAEEGTGAMLAIDSIDFELVTAEPKR